MKIYVVEESFAESVHAKSDLAGSLYFSSYDKARDYVASELEKYQNEFNDGCGEYEDKYKRQASIFRNSSVTTSCVGCGVFHFADGSEQYWDVFRAELH